MGLLKPSSGITLDNNDLYEGNNIFQWRQEIAHAPQEIYLADAFFSENIAIGKTFTDIDMKRVNTPQR